MLYLNNSTTTIPTKNIFKLKEEEQQKQLNNNLISKGSRTWSINKTTNKQPPIITNLLNILNNKINEKELLNDSGLSFKN